MKEKLITWTENVKSRIFSNFPGGLEFILKTCNWENENPEREGKLKQLVSDHPYFLSENFSLKV